MSQPSILVVGAGVAGLACASELEAAGLDVQILDKGRGPGGRLSARRSPVGAFDHGTPDFTAKDVALKADGTPPTPPAGKAQVGPVIDAIATGDASTGRRSSSPSPGRWPPH